MSQGNINININITNSKKGENLIQKISNLIINRTPSFKATKTQGNGTELINVKSSFKSQFKKKKDLMLYSKHNSELFDKIERKSIYKKRSSHINTKSKNFSDKSISKKRL